MILVIDDHWETCRSIERLLTFQGYPVRTAMSGSDGILLARDCRPRLIVADSELLNMPAEDLQRALRMEAGLYDVPTVFYTPREPSIARDVSVNFGPRDWLTRCGVSWSELLGKVGQAYSAAPPLTVSPLAAYMVG